MLKYIQQSLNRVEEMLRKPISLESFKSLPEDLLQRFCSRHSMHPNALRYLLDSTIDPIYDAIAAIPLVENRRGVEQAFEWELYKIHNLANEKGWKLLSNAGDHDDDVDWSNELDDTKNYLKATFNIYLMSPYEFDMIWKKFYIKNIPEQLWTRRILPQDKHPVHSVAQLIRLETEIANLMCEQPYYAHKCNVGLLMVYDLNPITNLQINSGMYWIIYPEFYEITSDENFEGIAFKCIRPAYEIVIFEDWSQRAVDICSRGDGVDIDKVLSIWQRVIYGVMDIELQPDQTGINWKGKYRAVTSRQFDIIEYFYRAVMRGEPKLSQKYVLEELNLIRKNTRPKLREFFKPDHLDVYNDIFDKDGKGKYWLKII